jgi:hypothetical protein
MSNLFDHIHSYDVKHREIMKEVCIELLYKLEEIECSNCCGTCIRRLGSIYNNILFEDYYCCSEWCSQDLDYELRRSYRRSCK